MAPPLPSEPFQWLGALGLGGVLVHYARLLADRALRRSDAMDQELKEVWRQRYDLVLGRLDLSDKKLDHCEQQHRECREENAELRTRLEALEEAGRRPARAPRLKSLVVKEKADAGVGGDSERSAQRRHRGGGDQ